MGETVKFEATHRHDQRGYFSLKNLVQRPDVSASALSTGWWELDRIWKIYPGQFTIVSGIPGHGKSTFLLNVIVNLAREHAVRSFLYVPENEPHLREKMRKIWGNKPGFDDFAASDCFVQSALPDNYDDEPQDLSWVLDKAVVAIKRDEVGLLLIDPWNELEHAKPATMLMTDYIRLCLMYLKQFCRAYGVAVILVAHPTKAVTENGGRTPLLSDIEGCYSDDTEVLTKRGWLHHGQVTLSDDVACFDPVTSAVVYHQPSNILRKEFDGDLFHFKGYGYDLAVTPQHRMLVKPMWPEPVAGEGTRGRPVAFPKGQWSFCRAEDLPHAQFVVPLAGEAISGALPDCVQVGSEQYPAVAFWRLVGWFVAEGHVGPNGLTWAQAEGELAEAFTEEFSQAGIPATVGWQPPRGKGKRVIGRWYVGNRYSRDLVEWFREHCGAGAPNKKIPAAVFDLSPMLKRAFLAAYLQGDGSKDGRSATTVSRQLRDDLQRLAVELGISTSYGTRDAIGNSQECYSLRFGDRRAVSLRTGRNASRESYRGLVWCLTVPTGAYFVRRNGRVMACGNSMNWYNKCDNGLIIVRDFERGHAKIISAKVREDGAGKVGMCMFDVDPATGIFVPQYGAAT